MAANRVRGITAYVGNFSTWTHTFSTVLSTEFHVSDVDFITPSTVSTCIGTGVESRTPADSAPSVPDGLLDTVIVSLTEDSPRRALLASILPNSPALLQ